MKAIIYTRVSTDEQADKGYSLPYQKERLETYCKLYNIEIVKHYKDDHSAKSFDRPEFKKLIEFLHQNKDSIDLLLVLKWDRFSRNVTDAWMMIRTLKQLGSKIDAIEQPINFDIPEQKLMLSFYLTAGEVENDRRGINTSAGMRRAKKSGQWVSLAPLGYKNGIDINKKPILQRSDKAELIKEAFELYSTGLYEKEEVRKKMVKKGLNCKKNNFCKVLHNLVYCGKIFVPAWKDEPEEIVIGLHEPIVSEELFNKVQQVAAAKRYIKPKPSRRKETLPMRGYLICNKCGKNLTGSKSKGKGGIYHYYHCQNGCKERFRADAAHDNFTGWLNEITLKPDIAALYIADIEDTIKTEFGNTHKEIEQFEKAKQKSEDMRAKVERKYVEEIIDESTFKRVKKSYEDEIYNYSARIAELKNEDTDFKNYAEYCFTLLSKLNIAYERTDLEGKQKLLSSIFPNKLVFNGKSYRTPVQNEIYKILFNSNKAFEEVEMKKVGDNTDQCAVGSLSVSFSNSFKAELKQLYVLRDLIPIEFLQPEQHQRIRMAGA